MRGIAVATLAAAAAVAGPSVVAAAPTVVADRGCYAAGRDAIALRGSGYTPGAEVALFLAAATGSRHYSAVAGPDGAFATTVRAPTLDALDALPPGVKLTVSASDQARPEATSPEQTVAVTSVLLAQWLVSVPAWDGPAPVAHPRRPTTVSAYGWTTLGGVLYAHYVRDGRLVRTVRVGDLSGPCGSLTRRMRQFPFRPVRPGEYRVQYDTSASYRVRGRSFVAYRPVVVRRGDAVP